MLKKVFNSSGKVLWHAIKVLTSNDPLRMAGATAFFTTFALPAIVMILVRILGLFFVDRRVLGQKLIQQFTELLGAESAATIVQTMREFRELQHNYLITIGIFLFLIFVATTLFKIIKGSINQLWNVRRLKRGNVLANVQSRAISLLVILIAGILFFALQLIDAGQHMLQGYVNAHVVQSVQSFGAVWNTVIVVTLSALWFFVLFILLPDGRPYWKIGMWGALLTSMLFNIGKWVLQMMLKPGQISNFYGASGAIVLVLLFMFYSSMILYFGAAFVKALGDFYGHPIQPNKKAISYRLEEVAEH